MGKCLFMRKGETHTVPIKPVSRLPAGYTELEYIESTSDSAGAGEQYIDTEVIPSTNDFSVVMKASARVIDAENWFLTINRQMPEGTATYLQFGVRGNSTFATHLTYVAIDGTTAATTDIVDITFSVRGTTATQSGDATHTMTAAELQSGSYRNSSITIVNGNWRCYSCQIYLGDDLVRDYVPCIKPSTSKNLCNNFNIFANSISSDALDTAIITDEYIDITKQATYVYTTIPLNLEVGKTYTLSMEYTIYGRPDDATGYTSYAVGLCTPKYYNHRVNGTFTHTETITFEEGMNPRIVLNPSANSPVPAKFRFSKIMLNEGDTALPFEPYNGGIGLYDVVGQKFYGNAGTGTFIGSEVE